MSATATGMNLIMNIAKRWKKLDLSFREQARTDAWLRLLRLKIILGLSLHSSIRNLYQDRQDRKPYSAILLKHHYRSKFLGEPASAPCGGWSFKPFYRIKRKTAASTAVLLFIFR